MAGSLTCREAQRGLGDEGPGGRAGGVGLPVPSVSGEPERPPPGCRVSAPHLRLPLGLGTGLAPTSLFLASLCSRAALPLGGLCSGLGRSQNLSRTSRQFPLS